MRLVEELRFAAMGGDAHVVVVGGPPGLVCWAERRVAELEARWSRFRATSDVGRCNDHAGDPVFVHPDTITLLTTAIDAWWRTNGRFDPTVHDALVAAGYDRTFAAVARVDARPASRVSAPGCAGIVIDVDHAIVQLPVGVRIDPGGIGKGLAADLVVDELLAQGAAGALVSIGGDLRASGRAPWHGSWTIDVEDPFDIAHSAGRLALAVGGDIAVATSSTLGRRWHRAGAPVHHLLDPGSGRPLDAGLVAATVIARRGWLADVATKVVLDGGPWPRGLGAELPAIVFTADGRRELRSDAEAYLHAPVAPPIGQEIGEEVACSRR